MDVGIHLPQYGHAAGPASIRRAAVHAEALGYAHIWVSDHIVSPVSQRYPSPYLYDPLTTLAFAAALTGTVGLGTSVLVAPQHNPLALANTLASLDSLSDGRVTVALGIGWSRAEFDALGYTFDDRGERTDEIVDVLRRAWGPDPVSHHGRHYRFADLRVQPKPAHPIPIWIGGQSPAAHRRAVARGDGFHAIGLTPDEAATLVARLREDRPDPSFTISLRTGWDALDMEHDRIRAERDAYEAAGIQAVLAAPWRRDLDSWLRAMEVLAELVGLNPR